MRQTDRQTDGKCHKTAHFHRWIETYSRTDGRW